MKYQLYLLAFCLAAGFAQSGEANIVTLTPGDINGGDTNTAMFDDGSLQLVPLIGDTATTFNANAARLGVDNNGTNLNAFNDIDTDPNNNNDERLSFSFAATSGLTQISWDFSRADGADSGVFITGFASDPGASFTGNTAGFTSSFDAMTGTLSFELPNPPGFSNDDGFLNLSNPLASAGQTLELRVIDTDLAGAQLAITSISYNNNVVPEPSSIFVLISCCLAGVARRRR
jgi:hypothetical protein